MRGLLHANLRTPLTVLYGSLLALALLVYAGSASALFLRNLRKQLDSSLHRDVETVEGALSMDRNGTLQISSRGGEANEDEIDHGYLLEVWSLDNKLLYRSEQLHDKPLGPIPTGSPASNRQPAHSIRLGSGLRLRLIGR